MAPSPKTTRESASDRSLRLVSFGALATAVVGSGITMTLSLDVYSPSPGAAELPGGGATSAGDAPRGPEAVTTVGAVSATSPPRR